MDIAIHTNTALAHQREHAENLAAGCTRHGIKAEITASIDQAADIHIVMGPWYAKQRWLGHDRVILLDRCYYKGDPEHVSIGWMRHDGGRTFYIGDQRRHPAVVPKDRAVKSGTVFLADYDGPHEQADTIRLHPARKKPDEPLETVLRRHGVAIGYQTSALVTAGIEGLEVICRDSRNIMAEPNWTELLPFADWSKTEIKQGEAWEHLCQQL